MVRICFSLLLTTFISGAAFADCTSAETATQQTFMQCSKEIRLAIYNASPAVTAADVAGKAYRVVFPYQNVSNFQTTAYVYYKDTGTLYNSVTSSDESSVEYGLFSILQTGRGSNIDWRHIKPENGKFWKGTILFQYYGGDTLIYEPVFPMAASALIQTMNADGVSARFKTDALAAYLPTVSNPAEKVLFLMDFLRKVEISGSDEVGKIAIALAALDDQRSNRIFFELLRDGRVKDAQKKYVIQAASYNNPAMDPPLMAALTDLVSERNCASAAASEAMRLFPKTNPMYEAAVSQFVAFCGAYDFANEHGEYVDGLRNAFVSSTNLKMKTSVLPAMDFLSFQASTSMFAPKTINQWADFYTQMILSTVRFLGASRSTRALTVLKSASFYNSARVDVAKATREAIDQIENGERLISIQKGSLESLQWAMDMITYHDGAMRALQFEILNAFEKAMKVSPTAKARIKAYLKKENAEGYHDYDAELSARMKAVAAL